MCRNGFLVCKISRHQPSMAKSTQSFNRGARSGQLVTTGFVSLLCVLTRFPRNILICSSRGVRVQSLLRYLLHEIHYFDHFSFSGRVLQRSQSVYQSRRLKMPGRARSFGAYCCYDSRICRWIWLSMVLDVISVQSGLVIHSLRNVERRWIEGLCSLGTWVSY